MRMNRRSLRAFLLGATLIVASPAHSAAPILLSAPDTANTADIAIVMVHGLKGNPRTSFGNWPAIIAADPVPLRTGRTLSSFAVYGVDYESSFESTSVIEEIAGSVANDLFASEIFDRHRHVIFVSHSLGGLVVGRVLAIWHDQNQQLLINRTLGVALLGVPSGGSPIADLATKYGADDIAELLGLNGQLVEELKTDSGSYLIGLENGVIALKQRRDRGDPRRFTPILLCAYETQAEIPILRRLGIDTRIVDRIYAATSVCDERAQAIDVRHTEMNKPTSSGDSLHLWFRSFLDKAIAASEREVLVELTTGPLRPDQTLHHRVATLNSGLSPTRRDPATLLPVNPERIDFADPVAEERSRTLALRGGPFGGPTKLAAMRRVAEWNSCVVVEAAPNGMTITLDIADTEACTGGLEVCRGLPCE